MVACLHITATCGCDHQLLSELRAAGFKLKEVLPSALETAVRGGLRTRGRDYEDLRSWVLKGLFFQWMMTLNSGHDVSE